MRLERLSVDKVTKSNKNDYPDLNIGDTIKYHFEINDNGHLIDAYINSSKVHYSVMHVYSSNKAYENKSIEQINYIKDKLRNFVLDYIEKHPQIFEKEMVDFVERYKAIYEDINNLINDSLNSYDYKISSNEKIHFSIMREYNSKEIKHIFIFSDIPNYSGGETISKLAEEFANHEAYKNLGDIQKNELQTFFIKNILPIWDKPYGELSENELSCFERNMGYFSDWHKDLYGHRPHDNESNECYKKYLSTQELFGDILLEEELDERE